MPWSFFTGVERQPLLTFVEDMLRFCPPVARAIELEEWLWDEIGGPGRLLVVRKSARPATDIPRFDDCGGVYEVEGVPFISTDNEATASFYELTSSVTLRDATLLSLLQQGHVATGTVKPRKNHPAFAARKKEIVGQLSSLGIKPGMAKGARLKAHNLKVSHLASANEGLRDEELQFPSRLDEMRLRAYRTLSPLNCVPTASPDKYRHSLHKGGQEVTLHRKDLGESAEVLTAFLAAQYERFRAVGAHEAATFERSLNRSRIHESICPRRADGAADMDALLRKLDVAKHWLVSVLPPRSEAASCGFS